MGAGTGEGREEEGEAAEYLSRAVPPFDKVMHYGIPMADTLIGRTGDGVAHAPASSAARLSVLAANAFLAFFILSNRFFWSLKIA